MLVFTFIVAYTENKSTAEAQANYKIDAILYSTFKNLLPFVELYRSRMCDLDLILYWYILGNHFVNVCPHSQAKEYTNKWREWLLSL